MSMAGILWHSTKPTYPLIGDCYLDPAIGQGFVWQGSGWIPFIDGTTIEPPFSPPTEEQLEKHPSLKQAWEEFLVVKRLLGV